MTDRVFKAGDLYLYKGDYMSWLCMIVQPTVGTAGCVEFVVLSVSPSHPLLYRPSIMDSAVLGRLTKVSA
jgi:hypothetical protein